MQKIIEIKGGVVRHPQMRMGAPIDFELRQRQDEIGGCADGKVCADADAGGEV